MRLALILASCLLFWALLAYFFPIVALVGSLAIALVLILGALSSMEGDKE